jgi:hypothetical protein
MAKKIGRLTDVAISNADSSYTEIANIKSAEFAINRALADATDNDSGGNKDGLYADAQRTISLTANYDIADAGQLELVTAAEGGTTVWLRLRPEATAGEREWRQAFLIASLTKPSETAAVQELTATFESTGAPVVAVQP